MLTKQFRQFEQWAEDQERTKALKNKNGMNAEEQKIFDELTLRCSKTKYRIEFIPAKDGEWGGDKYWDFYYVDEKGFEYGRENFFSIKKLQEEVEEYLNI